MELKMNLLFVDQVEELVEPLFVDQEVEVELKMNLLFVDQAEEGLDVLLFQGHN